MIKVHPQANHFGLDTSEHIPPPMPDLFETQPLLGEIWGRARSLLAVRDNDMHTLYSLSLASALLDEHPQADPGVVLPAIMLHDIGWSEVEPGQVLAAIAPGGGRTDLVLQHEKAGARLATEILESLRVDPLITKQVAAIVDGHDSRSEAIGPEDEIVKDADKLWLLTPHGLDTVMDWFGLHRGQALRLCASRVLDKLFTPQATTMAHGLLAFEQANLWPRSRELHQ
ncbi:HD domain-containing protein [Paeniglutamicibacter psychrophenolicus]|uniref:HD domain-containing protein n=1 Tax=Paeniglutamicibacter psychrophenolicus TaxID=257454 RepID=UPI002788B8DD|nr:HD domain-containing protein [Paeniglutamicibacter psychrophenolicus]MDQ0093179.1 HD superfamily phosphodiesterase [Paeniglutamicibacter psychrophenolicus]